MFTARDTALATIQQEHLSLARVLYTLNVFLQRVENGVATPEFDMFSAALCYLDDFQERCHHPKEDDHLFIALNAATSEYSEVIAGLQAAHRGGAKAMNGLYRGLVHYQGGMPDGLKMFRAGIAQYASQMYEHIRIEEDLLVRCRDVLDEAAWARIAAAFEQNDDPLFGSQRRDEFLRLYQRIHRLTPRKFKQGLMAEVLASDVPQQ